MFKNTDTLWTNDGIMGHPLKINNLLTYLLTNLLYLLTLFLKHFYTAFNVRMFDGTFCRVEVHINITIDNIVKNYL